MRVWGDVMKSLNDLELNKEAIVIKVAANENIKNRLLDIGLVPRSKIKTVLISPGKDMVAYQIKGAIIAIRKDDTKDIMVEEL